MNPTMQLANQVTREFPVQSKQTQLLLRDIVATNNYERMKLFYDGVVHLSERLRESGLSGPEKAAKGMELAEQVFEQYPPGDDFPLSCKSGCSFCCTMDIGITESELELILDIISQVPEVIDMDRLKRQFYATPAQPLKIQERTCSFLDRSTGQCNIYEYRPLSCRGMFSLGKPKLCSVDHADRQTKLFIHFDIEVVRTAFYNSDRLTYLAEALPPRLGLKKRK